MTDNTVNNHRFWKCVSLGHLVLATREGVAPMSCTHDIIFEYRCTGDCSCSLVPEVLMTERYPYKCDQGYIFEPVYKPCGCPDFEPVPLKS